MRKHPPDKEPAVDFTLYSGLSGDPHLLHTIYLDGKRGPNRLVSRGLLAQWISRRILILTAAWGRLSELRSGLGQYERDRRYNLDMQRWRL